MKLKMKVLSAAVALLTVAGTAQAQSTKIHISNGLGQNGELFLTVWNPAAESSYGLDLNVLFTDMLPVNSASGDGAGFSRDLSTDANWNSVLAGATSGLQFAVTASSGAVVYNADYSGYINGLGGLMSTVSNDPAIFLKQAPNFSLTGSISTTFEQMISRLNIADVNGPVVGSSFVTLGDQAYWDNARTLWGNKDFMYNMADAVDGAGVDFYFNQMNFDESGFTYAQQGNSVSQLGQFTLTSAGQLTYTAVSAVPVPAAVWLFGSGLLGLAGVARRRV